MLNLTQVNVAKLSLFQESWAEYRSISLKSASAGEHHEKLLQALGELSHGMLFLHGHIALPSTLEDSVASAPDGDRDRDGKPGKDPRQCKRIRMPPVACVPNTDRAQATPGTSRWQYTPAHGGWTIVGLR